MKKLLATIGIVSTLAPVSAFAFSLEGYEMDTQAAHRYVDGRLDQRLIELGSNFQTGEFTLYTGRGIKQGVERFCAFYARFGIQPLGGPCFHTINVHAVNGDFQF